MNIDQLPDVALHRVMEFLPFVDQVRVGRVSQRFREFSQIVVSRTKSLNFGDEKVFECGIEPEEAIALLELCSSNLEAVEFGANALASQIFSRGFRLEHCTRLELKFAPPSRFARYLSDDQLSRIISQHSNVLESLSYPLYPLGQLNLDDGTIFEKLRHLELEFDDESGAFESLTRRCPNLVSFKFLVLQIATTTFDRFLESVPRLQSFEMLSHSYNLELENCANFFQLPLTVLKLEHIESSPYDYINDGFVRKIVECFPDLEQLALYLDCLSAAGASMLCRHLVKLRELTVHTFDDCDEHLEVPIVSNSLESFDIRCHEVTVQVFVNILIACAKLRRVVINNIEDIRTKADAVEMLSNVENLGLVAREITIVFSTFYRSYYASEYRRIWKSNSVEQALVEFKTRNNFEIRIEEIDTEEYEQEADDEDEYIDCRMGFGRMYWTGVDEDQGDIDYSVTEEMDQTTEQD